MSGRTTARVLLCSFIVALLVVVLHGHDDLFTLALTVITACVSPFVVTFFTKARAFQKMLTRPPFSQSYASTLLKSEADFHLRNIMASKLPTVVAHY